MKKASIIFLFSLFLISCENPKEFTFGRYIGEKRIQNTITPIVASISSSDDKKNLFIFEISETLASSKNSRYLVERLNSKQLKVSGPGVDDILLKVQDSCASGLNLKSPIEICWSPSDSKLTLTDKQNLVAIDLRLSNDFPVRVLQGSYSLDEIVGRTKFQSYQASQDAEILFQAKQQMKAARADLLPKFNIRTIAGVFAGDYLDVVGNVLPFLFPSNWYHAKATGELYLAQKSSFASLRGNLMNSMAGLFFIVKKDQDSLVLLQKHLNWLRQTKENLEQEEKAGTLAAGYAQYFSDHVVLVEQDSLKLEDLIGKQKIDLAHGAALSVDAPLDLLDFELPNLDKIEELQPLNFKDRVLKNSHELETLRKLLSASKLMTNELIYGFLNPESDSTLGFGTGKRIKISKSEQKSIENKIKEMESNLLSKLLKTGKQYNFHLKSYKLNQTRLAVSKGYLQKLVKGHTTGELSDAEFVESLIDIQEKILEIRLKMLSDQYSWLIEKSNFDRLLLDGFYSDLSSVDAI